MAYKEKLPYTILKIAYHYLWLRTEFRRVFPDNCISLTGFSFGKQGWHHLVELLKQIENKVNLRFENSILYCYHKKYLPDGMYELVRNLDEDIRFRPRMGVFPWGAFQIGRGLNGKLEGVDWKRSRFCGPTDDELVRKEFDDFQRLYQRIKTQGYKPWKWGFIGGTLLKRSCGETRFIPLQGNHRTAILAYLNQSGILVCSRKDSHSFIHEKDVLEWHYVKTGQCSKEDALAYFNSLFELTGFEQARRFDLIQTQ